MQTLPRAWEPLQLTRLHCLATSSQLREHLRSGPCAVHAHPRISSESKKISR
jgi:hypothetical protein